MHFDDTDRAQVSRYCPLLTRSLWVTSRLLSLMVLSPLTFNPQDASTVECWTCPCMVPNFPLPFRCAICPRQVPQRTVFWVQLLAVHGALHSLPSTPPTPPKKTPLGDHHSHWGLSHHRTRECTSSDTTCHCQDNCQGIVHFGSTPLGHLKVFRPHSFAPLGFNPKGASKIES